MTVLEDLGGAVSVALSVEVRATHPLSGGDVAISARLELADGEMLFAKTHPGAPPGFFRTEAIGLRWLRDTGDVAVPEVLAVSDGDPLTGASNMLVLEWIDVAANRAALTARADVELGRGLAEMHARGIECFGRVDRRSTGSRGLPNEPCSSWAEFYATQRLLPLAELALAGRALPSAVIGQLEGLAGRLADVGGPAESPSLLHGDLWAGNRLIDVRGRSWLIDPAAHGGHRESDLAMMRLFGGFGSDCFESYAEVFPLADGWEERVALHQIAPLVVHAIKFGGGYVGAASDAIGAYS